MRTAAARTLLSALRKAKFDFPFTALDVLVATLVTCTCDRAVCFWQRRTRAVPQTKGTSSA